MVEWGKTIVISYGELQRLKIDHYYVSGTWYVQANNTESEKNGHQRSQYVTCADVDRMT